MKKVLFRSVQILVFIFCLLSPFLAQADIYRFIDSDGVLHFTNVPVSSGYKLYIRDVVSHYSGPFSTDKYDNYIQEASKKWKLSFHLIKAMIKVESNFNPRAVSDKGAKGLMQIMPQNFNRLNIIDPFDPRENILGGARYLKMLIRRFNGKLPLALAAYNAGPTIIDQYKRIPPYKETQNYVQKVMKTFNVFKK